MPWDVERTIEGNDRVLLPFSFTSRVIAIDISSANQKPNWYRSGFLRAILDLDGQPFVGANIEMAFGQQVIELPFANYQIDFAPRVWLTQTTIKIKQLTTTQIGANFMGINYPAGVAPTSNSGTTSSVVGSTTSTIIAVANPLRLLGGLIINNTTKNLWLRFDAVAATPAPPCVMVPPGGNMDIDDGYVGQVTGISEAGVAGNINVVQYLTA